MSRVRETLIWSLGSALLRLSSACYAELMHRDPHRWADADAWRRMREELEKLAADCERLAVQYETDLQDWES